ncbi:DUF484 family protein [Marinicella sp. S1101]|uniref:DUF484 family protein n=1 Tax=Marinicella marina TaxID=2996016 RepID=UPI0022609FE1|nr:DUF484 family protein [Marinicella marina]MCX7554374.1 DUF484 family protein [Marinicella marina]MDJ1138635.1 DUF484 family protein [Marinicella marina]
MSDDLKIQKAIKNYLLKNPQYFAQHPELINQLSVAQPNGELTDLTSHQLRSLQKENRELKQKMTALMQNAQQSESVMDRLFNLLLQLSVVDGSDFIDRFIDFVAANFKADYFKIMLAEKAFIDEESDNLAPYTANQQNHFSVFQSKSAPISGRLRQEQLKSVFPTADDIKSAVVLPIGEAAEYGIMVFGSVDQEKFHPHSATDLLQKLTDILATYLQQTQAAEEAQATS